MTTMDQIGCLLRTARRAVAFTGAGISTESGIPDFRSPGGVWSKHAPVMYNDFLGARAARERYWVQRNELYRQCRGAVPNAGHRVLAGWEAQGLLRAVITQNIDGLHQDAGSRRVLELHGTNRIVACVQCGKEWDPEEICRWIDAGDTAPDCDACGGPLKSKTISFGQAMPAALMFEASQLARESDLFLAIGSSLVVEPAASLPRMAAYCGAALVILNRDPTPLDGLARLLVRAPIGITLEEVNRSLAAQEETRPPRSGVGESTDLVA